MPIATRPVRFAPLKYGQFLAVDSSSYPRWTGIVPDGEPHALDFHEFLVVSSGKATIHVNGTRQPVEGPAIFFTPPHLVRRVEIEDPMRLELVVCSSKALQSAGWISALKDLPAGRLPLTSEAAWPSLAGVARNMQDELRSPMPDSGLLLDALLTQFLIVLDRSRRAGAEDVMPALVRDFAGMLERDARRHHDVRYYARRLGVSADYLSTITRASCGMAAKRMIDRRLFSEAAKLLTQTTTPVSAIASLLGFEEPSHFTRFLIRMDGRPPSSYRRHAEHGIR